MPAPKNLSKDALKAVESSLGDQLEWTPLAGGRTNYGWLVKSETRSFVVKLFNAAGATPLFPNDPHAEWRCLEHLKGTRLAPEPIEFFHHHDAIVYEYVDGQALLETDSPVMKSLSKLHSVSPPENLRKLSSSPQEMQLAGRRILAKLETPLAKKLASSEPRRLPRPMVSQRKFLHGDPTPSNCISTVEGLCFIDWQCPAFGDPIEDIAIALSPAMHVVHDAEPLNESSVFDLLSAYADEEVCHRYLEFRQILAWRMAAYCAWKEAKGDKIYAIAAEAELTS